MANLLALAGFDNNRSPREAESRADAVLEVALDGEMELLSAVGEGNKHRWRHLCLSEVVKLQGPPGPALGRTYEYLAPDRWRQGATQSLKPRPRRERESGSSSSCRPLPGSAPRRRREIWYQQKSPWQYLLLLLRFRLCKCMVGSLIRGRDSDDRLRQERARRRRWITVGTSRQAEGK